MIQDPCILTDVTKCIGCEECVAACKRVHDLPAEDPPPRIEPSRDGLTDTRWTTIIRLPEGANVRKHCRHCLDPACVSVCPVGALKKTPEGPVVYDKWLCIGCRYCMMACPYGIPRYEWRSPNPAVRKCTMCFEKVMAGEIEAPACVTACPEKATIFGSREELLAEAHRRIAAEPGKYIDHVWGEHEFGGSRVLYISHVDLGFLAWRDPRTLGHEALPGLTWAALRKVPYEFLGVGALMTGVWWVIDRRMRREEERRDGGEGRRAEEPPRPGAGGGKKPDDPTDGGGEER